jgi:hypothetical protein
MDPDIAPMSPYGAQRRARTPPQAAEPPTFYPRKSLRHRA